MSTKDTWALPIVKARLLAGERLTQANMLAATGGRAWRLSAAIHYLRHRKGWEIVTTLDGSRVAHYHLPPREIARIRAEMAREAA